jgi:hypothetical protein
MTGFPNESQRGPEVKGILSRLIAFLFGWFIRAMHDPMTRNDRDMKGDK